MNMAAMRGEMGNPQGERPDRQGERPDPNRFRDMLLKNQTDIEIVGPNNEATRLSLSEAKGIELKLGLKDNRMVYEMKVPLQHTGGFNYVLSADTGSTISVGLETGTFQANRSGQPGEGGFRRPEGGGEGGFEPPSGEGGGDDFGGGGMRGGGRRGGFGRGGGRANISSISFEPLDFWAKVKLAGK